MQGRTRPFVSTWQALAKEIFEPKRGATRYLLFDDPPCEAFISRGTKVNNTLTRRLGAMRQAQFGRGSARHSSKTVCGLFLAIGLATTAGFVHAAEHGQNTSSAVVPAASTEVSIKHRNAKPTDAWVRFCRQRPEECRVNLTEPDKIELTAKAWQTIVQVNRDVNAAIRAKTDKAHWGVEDRWDFAEDGYGDCEDYQLVKRKRLAEAGLPRRALRMTVVIDEVGAGHAVMMVRTDRGEFVLDNKHDAVLPWTETGYTYVKREGDHGAAWASLGGAVASPVATAGR